MRTPVAVLGSGPIGAATAYALTRSGAEGVVLVGGDAGPAAYRSSGGSISWYRNDPEKTAMIERTARFVRERVAAGAAIRLADRPYLLLDAGVQVPALNVAATDLVADLIQLSGAAREDLGRITAVEPAGDGYRVTGDRGTLEAGQVVLALGTGNLDLVDLDVKVEKRQLFVLDLPVDEGRAALPHLVTPVGPGYAYVFVKDTRNGLRLLLGQEDLIADDRLDGPVDHLAELLDAGVADRFPFLRGAAAEQVLWGVDLVEKLPRIVEHAPGFLSVNCGSAVRACVAIGERVAAALDRTG